MSSNENLIVTPCKTLLTTSNPFEKQFGYHRAVRRGPFIAVSGTTALKLLPSTSSDAATESESKVHFPGDAHAQAVHVLNVCLAAVTRLGGKKEDVVRVRMFVADGKDCGVVGDAFRECFGTRGDEGAGDSDKTEDVVGATATMIVVPGGFVDGGILVEIEIEAFVV